MQKKTGALKQKKVVSAAQDAEKMRKIAEEIRYKAYLKFQNNGRKHGNGLAHWLEAEREVKKEHALI